MPPSRLLAEIGTLPPGYRPHELSGEWKGVWECHIEPDWLLIYNVTDEEVPPDPNGYACRPVRVARRADQQRPAARVCASAFRICRRRAGVTGSRVMAPGKPIASSMADAIAAPTPVMPLSPAPLMPSGLSGLL